MYKLTVEFKNNEELAAFVAKLGGLPVASQVQHTMPVIIEQPKAEQAPPVVEDKPKKAKAKKEEVAELPQDIPPVIEAPKPAPKPVTPKIDRDAIVSSVTSMIKDLTDAGVKGPEIAKILSEIYVATDCPAGTKISQLEDAALARFYPVFVKQVADIKGQTLVDAGSQSFV